MKRIRVGIVGAGLMGRWHACYAQRCGATIAGIVDPDVDAARAVTQRCAGAPVFAALHECLQSAELDAMHICTDVASHAELVTEALQAGKHVLVEKPAAESYTDTLQLTNLATAQGKVLTCVHQFPFQAGVAHVRQALDRIGPPEQVTFTALTAGADGCDANRRRSILLEILPHPISLVQSLFGADLSTSRWSVTRFTSDELYLAGRIGKTHVDIRMSTRGRPTRNELTIVGTRGTAHVNLFHGFTVIERGAASRAGKILQPFRLGSALCLHAGMNLIRRTLAREPAYPGLRNLIERFYRALNGTGDPPVSQSQMLEAAWFVDRVRAHHDTPTFAPAEAFDLTPPATAG